MSNIKAINTSKANRNQVSEVLTDVIEMQFEEVIIFGFKDNQIYTKRSRIGDTLRTLGALDMAKHDLLKD